MKSARLAVMAVMVCMATAAWGEIVPVAARSAISRVTVYGDRGVVTRDATVQLHSGMNLLVFDSLPLLLDEESLRVEGSGPARARIAGVTVKNVFLDRLPEAHIRELEEQIRSLTRAVEKIDARTASLDSQRAFIDSIRVGWGERISKELATGKPTAAELREAVAFVGEGVARVESERRDAEAEKKPLLDRIAALEKELEQARGGRKKEVRSVEVAVDAPRPGDFTLSLSYLVRNARWEPSYDVRLAADGGSAELVYRGMVAQSTGEDWSGVRMALSTARPEVGGAPPDLQPWRVWFPVPRPTPYAPRMKALMEAVPAPAAPAAAGMPEDDAMARGGVMTAGIAEGETSVLFEIPLPVDVPADGSRHGSVISVTRVPVVPEFVTVPKLSERVYLKTVVKNDAAYPLLRGPVNVFNDTTFTGKANLKTVAAGESFDLFFGADDRIKVKREVLRTAKEGGIFGGSRISYRCSVELQNFRKEEAPVTVLDQLPLAGNEEIKVALAEPSVQPAEKKDDGTVSWKLLLKPGEKRIVTYDILIDYPKGRELAGAE